MTLLEWLVFGLAVTFTGYAIVRSAVIAPPAVLPPYDEDVLSVEERAAWDQIEQAWTPTR